MEHSLIKRAKAGHETAWQELINTYREDVFRLAYLMLANAEDAQDVAQETFVRALNNLHSYDETRPLRPWLLKITANLARNYKRTVYRYWNALRMFRGQVTEGQPSVEGQIIQQEEVNAILGAIHQLRPVEQEIIYCRYFLELSVTETATTLNIKAGTVKSRLHRALQKLELVIYRDYPELAEKRV